MEWTEVFAFTALIVAIVQLIVTIYSNINKKN